MRVERFSDWAALGIGEAGWNRLVERCRAPVPFATWQFQTAWFRAFAPGSLHLLGAQDGAGEWVGLLPLYETPTPEGPVLRLVGGTDIADYLDLIAVAGREEEVWKAVLPALGDLRWRAVDLRPIPAASPTSSLLESLAASAGLRCRVDVEERCPVIELADTWDGYLAGLPGKGPSRAPAKDPPSRGGPAPHRGCADCGRHERPDGQLRRPAPALQGRQGEVHGRAHGEVLPGARVRAGRGRAGGALDAMARGSPRGRALLPRAGRERQPLQLRIRSRGAGDVPGRRAHRSHDRGRDRARFPALRLPAGRGAVQVRLRRGARPRSFA